jgi:tRNA1(Val) A37 N6-methylase TrmN6
MHRITVSNFRPTVARALLHRYSGSGETVLDFSAGYGGRLLGALTLSRNYTGIDPSRAQFRGLNSMVKSKLSHSCASARLIQGCAEEILPTWDRASFSVVFSSPPYFNRERYSDEPTQSYLRYPTYEEWKKQFLTVILGESFRLLEKGGHLLLNIANTGAFAIASDAEQICRRDFGRPRRVLRMLMPSNPADRAQRPRLAYRWEPVYVFRKA